MTVISSSSLVVISILPVLATGWTVLVPLSRRNNNKLVCHSFIRSNILLKSKLFGPEGEEESFNDDDFGQLKESFAEAENSSGGAELAKDFFNELRQRNQNLIVLEETSPSNDSETGPSGGPSSTNMLSNNNISLTDSPNMDDLPAVTGSTSPVVRRKFTGRQGEGEQRSFFAAQDQSSSPSVGQARTPREVMMEREYQLVRRAETGIIGQAIVAVLALLFYIYVGLSGGIVTGRDAQMQDWGADDEIPFEQLMPVQRDREVSIWL